MSNRITDRNIWLVYATILLLGIGYGSTLSVLAVFLDARGFSKTDIGWLATVFAVGIIGFSIPVGALIRRFSARTTLLGSLVGFICAVTIFPFLTTFPQIAAARFVDGICSAGVWVSCETILLSRADADNKAFVTSRYAQSIALGYVLGPLCSKGIVRLFPLSAAFFLAGAMATIAFVLVRLRLDPDRHEGENPIARDGEPPQARIPEGEGSSALGLLARIKCSCFATFAYGYFQASVVLFLPLFLIEKKGVTQEQTILVTGFFAAGMLGFTNVAGKLGDRHGHLLLMRALAVIGTAMVLGFVYLDSYPVMCVAVFIAGATLASISPVSLALQGVVVKRVDISRANGIYNVFYAGGMLLGPTISSRIYAASGGPAMLWHLAVLWMVFISFTMVFAGDDPARKRRAQVG